VTKGRWQGIAVAVKMLKAHGPVGQQKASREVAPRMDVVELVAKAGEEPLREASKMAKLRHPHVVALYGVFCGETAMFLVMEFCEKGSLCCTVTPQCTGTEV
jgi:serine/threonine protein kinase